MEVQKVTAGSIVVRQKEFPSFILAKMLGLEKAIHCLLNVLARLNSSKKGKNVKQFVNITPDEVNQ